jgi:thiol-disulfide isomerase/thioredoxin
MRLFLLILFFIPILAFAQDKNTMTIDSSSGKPMLIGFIDRTALSDSSFSWWLDSGYENYDVDLGALEPIANKMKDITFTVVLGTWCSDTRRELPRFFKIIDALNVTQPDQLTLIAVDRQKHGKEKETDALDITAVPTFIVFRDGTEIGRIVESPKKSLEQDLVSIILK